MPVHRQTHRCSLAEHFHGVPFSTRLLDFIWAAKSLFIAPGIPARTVESRNRRPFSHAVHGYVRPAHHQHVAGATLDDLRFDRFGPNLVFTDAVYEDAAVAGVGQSRRPRFLTPFELG